MLTAMYCKLQEKLHRTACRILKDEIEAQDAVQDAFCNLWDAELPTTTDEARFKLFAILKNVCLNKLKRKRPILGLEQFDRAIDEPQSLDAERIKALLLGAMSEQERRVFELSIYEELEYPEISELLGISLDAVRMNMCRARKKAAKQLNLLDNEYR